MQVGKNYINTEGTRVVRKGKHIFINQLSNPQDASNVIRLISFIINNPETKQVSLHFQSKFNVYSNIFAPIACAIEYLKLIGKKVVVHNDIEEFRETHFHDPLPAAAIESSEHRNPAGKVWKVTSSIDISVLSRGVVDHISRRLICEKDVLLGLEWSLYEMLDNIFVHSGASSGYFMYQIQRANQRLSFCIVDPGIGIYQSFIGSKYRPKTPVDAITLAITEGVTRNDDVGQGNGLFGVAGILTQNKGQLTITSGGSAIFYNRENDEVVEFDNIPTLDKNNQGTIIDVQLNTGNPIHLTSALRIPITNIRLEELENETGDHVIDVMRLSEGTGTRPAGKKMRLYTINIIKETAGIIVLNFEGIGMVSSSYADEFIGRLFIEIGEGAFGQRIRFHNTCETVKLIIGKAVSMRHKSRLTSIAPERGRSGDF